MLKERAALRTRLMRMQRSTKNFAGEKTSYLIGKGLSRYLRDYS